jgi:hypothetical protein
MGMREELIDGLTELEVDLETTFTWNGASIACVLSFAERGLVMEIGGFAWNVSLSVYVRKTLIPGVTADMDEITIDSTSFTADEQIPGPVSGRGARARSRNYKVISVRSDPTGAYWVLVCADPNSGR